MLSQKFISVQIRAELIPCGWPGRGGRDEQGVGADGHCSEFLTSFLYQKHLQMGISRQDKGLG